MDLLATEVIFTPVVTRAMALRRKGATRIGLIKIIEPSDVIIRLDSKDGLAK